MKTTRLLDPLPGAGGGVTAPVAPAQTTVTPPAAQPSVTTPQKPIDPGTAARQEREKRDAMQDIWEPKTETATPVVTAPAVVAPPVQQALTPQQIAQIAAETAGRMQPRPVVPAQPQFTQKEIDEQLGVFSVTPEVCTQLGLPIESAPVLDKLLKMAVTNAVRMSNVLVEQNAQKMMGTLQPHITFAQQQQHAYLEMQFREQNPDLKGYEPIINDVASKLKSSGFRGSQKEAFDKIAEGTRAYLKMMNITPAVASTTPGTVGGNTTTPTSKPNMSTVSAGSQGGAGGAPSTSSKKESWADIWQK